MGNSKLKRIVLTSMFAALTCVATMIIQIPSPMNGYINLGDSIILLSAWIMGPLYGTAASGIGSMLADILTGYVHYAPGTLVIKSLTAFTAYAVHKALEKLIKSDAAARIVSGISGEIIMVLGYFGYASLLLGKGIAAAQSIPGNCMQAMASIVLSVLIYTALDKTIDLQKTIKKQ